MARPGRRNPSSSSLSKDELSYRMDNPRRGYAAIFNQDVFDDTSIPRREGSEVDCQSLINTFSRLGFDVELFRDLTLSAIENKLKELSERDHSDCDCFVLTFMTHGVEGKLRSRDTAFDVNILWERFTADTCDTLANKPKIFIIQACYGSQRKECPNVGTTNADREGQQLDDNRTPSYTLPMRADFLLALSTTPGFVSWRSPELGSWYIQTLCDHLDLNGFNQDLLTLLTEVNNRVAIDQVDQDPLANTKVVKKQLPCFISMLIRDVKFTRKTKGCKVTTVKLSHDSRDECSSDEIEDGFRSRSVTGKTRQQRKKRRV